MALSNDILELARHRQPTQQRAAVLSIAQMLNPQPPAPSPSWAADTPISPRSAASPGTWSPAAMGPTSPNNYTYHSQPAQADHRAPWASSSQPRSQLARYTPHPTDPSTLVLRSWAPEGAAEYDSRDQRGGSYGGDEGWGSSSSRQHGGPCRGEPSSRVEEGYSPPRGLHVVPDRRRSSRPESPSTLDGSEGGAAGAGGGGGAHPSRPRHNFPAVILKVFMEKAEERILVNDDRCRFSKDQMVQIAEEAGVDIKKVETWYTNHRRRGFPQQMVEVLRREMVKAGRGDSPVPLATLRQWEAAAVHRLADHKNRRRKSRDEREG
ncbi:hypothetical protein C8A01DRAFT_36845 [Parachaetomium inaequale]|uniref:Homeobox domain-containing protein n=1 Tax=Parachaetomium inaequale TaxID=2588326 RepID=A0AAN6PE42_9PEZI|nr:hypothetical protein C8A01DRAFT_36845 [Parachaetomium inaequale]